MYEIWYKQISEQIKENHVKDKVFEDLPLTYSPQFDSIVKRAFYIY